MFRSLVLGCVLVLTACSPPIEESFDRTGEELIITIYLSKTDKDMYDLLLKKKGYEAPENLLGVAFYSYSDNECQIFALKPTTLDSNKTMTVGHELLHCIYGKLHD